MIDGQRAYYGIDEAAPYDDGSTKTLRDEFAMAAMAAIISVPADANAIGAAVGAIGGDPTYFITELAYGIADAMLAARNKDTA
ncbi:MULTISPECIES: hypothetical protein [unclassified Sinorhizobium]|uniref:hypothetical protein n=1 Tax=unclassified Sinorhizobium TaxID=2613772 RepID=UPI0035251B0C